MPSIDPILWSRLNKNANLKHRMKVCVINHTDIKAEHFIANIPGLVYDDILTAPYKLSDLPLWVTEASAENENLVIWVSKTADTPTLSFACACYRLTLDGELYFMGWDGKTYVVPVRDKSYEIV